MSEFNTIVYDEDDNPHNVLVKYLWVPPMAATQFQPSEGGPELEDIVCGMKLSKRQMEQVEQEMVDHAWALYHERDVP